MSAPSSPGAGGEAAIPEYGNMVFTVLDALLDEFREGRATFVYYIDAPLFRLAMAQFLSDLLHEPVHTEQIKVGGAKQNALEQTVLAWQVHRLRPEQHAKCVQALDNPDTNLEPYFAAHKLCRTTTQSWRGSRPRLGQEFPLSVSPAPAAAQEPTPPSPPSDSGSPAEGVRAGQPAETPRASLFPADPPQVDPPNPAADNTPGPSGSLSVDNLWATFGHQLATTLAPLAPSAAPRHPDPPVPPLKPGVSRWSPAAGRSRSAVDLGPLTLLPPPPREAFLSPRSARSPPLSGRGQATAAGPFNGVPAAIVKLSGVVEPITSDVPTHPLRLVPCGKGPEGRLDASPGGSPASNCRSAPCAIPPISPTGRRLVGDRHGTRLAPGGSDGPGSGMNDAEGRGGGAPPDHGLPPGGFPPIFDPAARHSASR